MTFDVSWFTKATAILRSVGINKVFKYKTIQNIVIKSFQKWKLGTELFGVKVIGKNKEDNEISYSFSGYNQGKVTAAFTAELVQVLLHNKDIPFGILHSHQIITDTPTFLAKLQQYDTSFIYQTKNAPQ